LLRRAPSQARRYRVHGRLAALGRDRARSARGGADLRRGGSLPQGGQDGGRERSRRAGEDGRSGAAARVAAEHQAGGLREVQQGVPASMRVALYTNTYVPFCGGVPVSVEPLRRGLEAGGHEAWVLAPRFRGAAADPPRVLRYPSVPASTYPEFPL